MFHSSLLWFVRVHVLFEVVFICFWEPKCLNSPLSLKTEKNVSVRDGIQNVSINSHTHNWLRVPAIQMAKPRPLPTFSPQAFADPPPPPSAPLRRLVEASELLLFSALCIPRTVVEAASRVESRRAEQESRVARAHARCSGKKELLLPGERNLIRACLMRKP